MTTTKVATHPRVFISYSHDTLEHAARVLDFAERLRDDGVDARIDVYEPTPPQSWMRWIQDEIDAADYVLVVCTEPYHRRYLGIEAPVAAPRSTWLDVVLAELDDSLGPTWEGAVLDDELYTLGAEVTTFIPVIFSDEDGDHTPAPLRNATVYHLATSEGYEDLYRRLTNQPAELPQPGALTKLPPLVRRRRIADPPTTAFAVLPSPPNPYFRGRTEILSRLAVDLSRRARIGLTGPQGSGTTETALHYAYLYQRSYTALFFTRAGSEAELIGGFVAIARALDLPEVEEMIEPAAAVDAAVKWLDTHDGWLLILDGVDEPLLLDHFLPSSGRGHLLVTSQAQELAALRVFESLNLPPFTPEEALAYLYERSERSSFEAAERRGGNLLAAELGRLPLPVALAGAYLCEHGDRFYNYQPIFRQRGRELAERGVLPVDGRDPIVTQCSLTLEAIARFSPAAVDLLHACAFLAPEDIPEELLTRGGGALGRAIAEELADDAPDTLSELLSPLLRYSLVQRGPHQTWTFHRQVHSAIRDHLVKPRDRDRWVKRAMKALRRAWAATIEPQECERLVQHIVAVAGYAEDGPDLAYLLQVAGHFLCRQGRFDESALLLSRALTMPILRSRSRQPRKTPGPKRLPESEREKPVREDA